jgi:hypothetical protein
MDRAFLLSRFSGRMPGICVTLSVALLLLCWVHFGPALTYNIFRMSTADGVIHQQ